MARDRRGAVHRGARPMLTKVNVIRTVSSSIGSNKQDRPRVRRRADRINRLLSQALNALAGVAIEVAEAGVAEPDAGSSADVA